MRAQTSVLYFRAKDSCFYLFFFNEISRIRDFFSSPWPLHYMILISPRSLKWDPWFSRRCWIYDLGPPLNAKNLPRLSDGLAWTGPAGWDQIKSWTALFS